MRYESWGRYPKIKQEGIFLRDKSTSIDFDSFNSVLGFGAGRSYGDSCLNESGVVLDTGNIDKFLKFDDERGVLVCEAGVSFEEIIKIVMPRGWFLPVTPGTKYVTVGGAIANDVHGKNHHVDGTFGHFVKKIELLKSTGEVIICSPEMESDLFFATIGGLGLTGLILSAEIELKPISSSFMDIETICFSGLNEFRQLSIESKDSHLYTVAWIDCMAAGAELGRGIFLRANHNNDSGYEAQFKRKLAVPFSFPGFTLNKVTIKCFNELYYGNGRRQHLSNTTSYFDSYFYPLDGIANWNRIYGKRGFLQYQFVVPSKDYEPIREILSLIARSGAGSFLAVLKEFGSIKSRGLLSFPREGVCLALDFPFKGRKTLDLFSAMDSLVIEAGGAVYPAKDATMTAESFRQFYPNIDTFKKFKDPKFNSSFWSRVMS